MTAKIKRKELSNRQKEVNELYEKNGLTPEVLDKQVKINHERNKYDLPDENEYWCGIITENGFKEFVQ